MFIAGSTLFTAGTLLAAFAGDQWALVGGRVVQGAGAAALSPAAMSVLLVMLPGLLVMFPGQQRARAMSAWGAASAIGGATGVLAGGLLAGTFGWSSVFLVRVPVSIAAIVLARRVLDDGARGPTRRFDPRGAALVTGAVVALVHGALGAAEQGWRSSATIASLAGAAVLLAAFVAVERRTADPLIPLTLFRCRVLSTGVGLAVLGGAAGRRPSC